LEAFVAGSGKLKNPNDELILSDIQTKNMRSVGLPSPANALSTFKLGPQP